MPIDPTIEGPKAGTAIRRQLTVLWSLPSGSGMGASLADMDDTATASLRPTGPIVIDQAHCGPPQSGNGGWVSGLLALRVPTTTSSPAVTVRLSSPPPLDRPLTVGGYGSLLMLQDGARQIATASPAPASALPSDLPAPATLAEAESAEAAYEGLVAHPFPTCFSCGTDRSPADALCLRPGPLGDGTGRYAARWTPERVDPAIAPAMVWAALDCPGGWSAGIAGRPMVLGSMTAQVRSLPAPGVEHIVTAWQTGAEGRKHWSASMLHDPEGHLLALASATWIAVDPESIRPAGPGHDTTQANR